MFLLMIFSDGMMVVKLWSPGIYKGPNEKSFSDDLYTIVSAGWTSSYLEDLHILDYMFFWITTIQVKDHMRWLLQKKNRNKQYLLKKSAELLQSSIYINTCLPRDLHLLIIQFSKESWIPFGLISWIGSLLRKENRFSLSFVTLFKIFFDTMKRCL